MTNKKEIVKFDASKYGLTETKAAEIEAAFRPMLETMTALETEFNAVITLPLEDVDSCAKAKTLRLKYVKVRTGTAAIHKEMKAYYLSGGRACDGWKNAQLHASEGNEAKLMEREKHFENIEKARVEKLQEERAAELEKIGADFIPPALGEMAEDVWAHFVHGVELSAKHRREAEEKAEAELIAKAKAEAEEHERIRLENEQLKKEAEENRIAEEKAQAERDRVEAERVAKLKAERIAFEKKEQKRIAKESAERKAIEDERRKEREAAERKLKAEREERERLEAERQKKEAAERKDREAKDAAAREEAERVANKKHRADVKADIECALGNFVDPKTATRITESISGGVIPHVSINY